jgi:FAD/FMN-containing dehydrogenase/Fe-S oxidoreductase
MNSNIQQTNQEPIENTAANLAAELANGIEGEVRFDDISRALYATDASVYQITPLGVVIPRSTDDVIHTLNTCRKHNVAITARGGGTSQAGQAIGAGVQIDFSKYMNRVIELNPDRQTVRVQPGIVLEQLNAFLKPYGLCLPLDLSTANRATIGGMIANNSSGTRSIIYGKTIDYVLELTVLLSDGSVVELCPTTSDELDAKCQQNDLEGDCYRVVRKLADDHQEEIERRFPKILRRVGGYNLDEFVPATKSFNLARLMVGSEGTLALVLEAKLRVVPLPQQRVVCVAHFHDLLAALEATPDVLEHQPSAVELLDAFILDTTRGKPKFEPLRDFVSGEPAAVLIVEFSGENHDELLSNIKRLEQDLLKRGRCYHVHHAIEAAAQAKIWELRRAALGLSMSQPGDAKSISFVEDTAVSPNRLRDYIQRFLAILEEHDTPAGFYAHASVGLLHIRPVINMKTAAGVAQFQRVAEQVADLVLEFGGALSGEHGDGLARSPFQEKMFGSELYQAFCEIKQAFDPSGILNPGKIVHARPITENLRFGPNYDTRTVETRFDFSEAGGISRAAEQCGGVGACRKTLTGTMCPSYMATRNEADSTRGRANVLRLAISGQLGPAALADERLFPILDLCLECKACKTECPTGVDMAMLKSEFLHHYYQKNGVPLNVRLIANIDRLATWGSRFAPVSNWFLQSQPARWLNERVLGLDRRRIPPQFSRRTFIKWWRNRTRTQPQQVNATQPTVALFADTFTNHFEPEHAIAAVHIAEACGAHVVVPPRVCCGRPLISKGLLDQARIQAERTTQSLLPFVEDGLPIVFCEPSCYSAVVSDIPLLLRGNAQQQAQQVATACLTFEQWFVSQQETKPDSLQFREEPTEVLLHGHCHEKSLIGMQPSINLFSAVPNCNVTEIDSGCCGMAGSFGYERNHYEISQAVAESRLVPAIQSRPAKSSVIASGFSCRHQIKHFTNVNAMSPVEFLYSLL